VAENKTETARLLVISRESGVLRPLWSVAESNAWHVETAASPWDAMERVQSGAAPSLLLLDLPRGDNDCLHILRWMRRLRPDLGVIAICSADETVRQREAIRLGAQEVLLKPFNESQLESAVRRHLLMGGDAEPEIGSEYIEQVGPDSFFVCASAITQKLRAQSELLAEADVPVLILGEPGTGKDTVARLIHKLSVRSGFQFLKVNCADMPADLLENELFGSRTTSGKVERAQKGTILLDEITEMPLPLQSKLMQILQDKVLARPGEKSISADVRILASTSASIEQALSQRRLREDLYYRLSAFTVQVPPIRQRKSEIPILLQHTMHRLARHYGLPAREFSASVLHACQQYSWPGNLRELESFVKRYLVSGEAEMEFHELISRSDIPEPVHAGAMTVAASPANGHHDTSGTKSLKSLIQNVKSEAERNAIGTALQKTGWNRKAAARLLQVSYRTLLYKIDQYHMNSSETFLSPLPASKFSLHGNAARNGKE